MVDLSDVKGHDDAKRAIEIAIVGRHSILLHGPMGCGKTMLLKAYRELSNNQFAVLDDIDHVEDVEFLSKRMDEGATIAATATEISYLSKRFIDRFPIVVELLPVSPAELIGPSGDSNCVIAKCIAAAQNAELPSLELKDNTKKFLQEFAKTNQITIRRWYFILAVAQTIARMGDDNQVRAIDIGEACSYVPRPR